ncbi:hypothetical protein PUV54_15560 [Hyphococcus flavus]|uniref:Uncharacterized protein n=1 Tax=Hyphococcus flavus TaxID=1866326 RepID=A0AAE9ZBU5_9PROT|nr:hypothetical protein [Hyphococcus flavus]WDI31366.1 hypothetical protein PUV54_15560 [Hyphococcus flavus]
MISLEAYAPASPNPVSMLSMSKRRAAVRATRESSPNAVNGALTKVLRIQIREKIFCAAHNFPLTGVEGVIMLQCTKGVLRNRAQLNQQFSDQNRQGDKNGRYEKKRDRR